MRNFYLAITLIFLLQNVYAQTNSLTVKTWVCLLYTSIHYTMVKTTMFNGVNHPSIAVWDENDKLRVVRKFNYRDFKERLS